ncbi:MAG: hypothetical protein Q9219_000077 [cf. Caloplaca sp. 3 TL-2023]
MRQGFLTRLALGRSAYAPLEDEGLPTAPENEEPISPELASHGENSVEVPGSESSEHTSGPYVQRFDSRGHPQNPTSRALSRASRRAQNDVLATVGILSGPGQAISGSQILAGSLPSKTKDRLLEETGNEADDSIFIEFVHFLTSRVLIWYLSIIVTLRSHSILQGLGLVPLRPFLPSMMAMVPFTNASSIQPVRLPTNLTTISTLRFLDSLAGSPLVSYFILRRTRSFIWSKAIVYFQLAIPKPDNPDNASIEVALERQEDARYVPGLNFRHDKTRGILVPDIKTVQELAERDWAALNNCITSLVSWSRSAVVRIRTLILSYRGRQSHGSSNQNGSEARRRESLPELVHETNDTRLGDDTRQSNDQSRLPFDHALPPPQPYGVDERTRNFLQIQDTSRPSHRVTFLTNVLANTMAVNLATVLTYTLTLPLEAFFVRSVALRYLSTGGGGGGALHSSRWLRNEIYPLTSWFGMGLRGGRAMDYAGKMVLCLGTEMALSYGVWQINAGVVWLMGTRMHGWGRL